MLYTVTGSRGGPVTGSRSVTGSRACWHSVADEPLSLAGGLHVHEILGRARISGAGARGGDHLGGAGLAGWLPGPCPWLAVTSPVAVCSHGLSSRHAQGGSGGPLPDAPSGLLRSQAKNRAGRSGGKNGSAGRGTEQRDTSTHGRGRGGTGGPGPGARGKASCTFTPTGCGRSLFSEE